MISYLAEIKRQAIAWLNKQGVRAVQVLKKVGRCFSYVTETGGKGACFIPAGVESGETKFEVPEYEMFKYSDRVSFMVQNLKKAGKNGRESKIINIYVGVYNHVDGLDLAMEIGCDRWKREIRDSKRVQGWKVEVALRGDWTFYHLDKVEAITTKVDRNPIEDFGLVDW